MPKSPAPLSMRCFLAVASVWLALQLIPALSRVPERVVASTVAARKAWSADPVERIHAFSLISTRQIETIREALPNDAEVVFYVPLPTPPWEEASVFQHMNRLRHLLYPEPRSLRLVKSEREGLDLFGQQRERGAVVVDYSRTGAVPAFGTGLELLYEEGPVRIWRAAVP